MSFLSIPILALCIPIIALILRAIRRSRELAILARTRQAEQRRRFACFDDLEQRVGRLEQYVTSPEFDLNRKLSELAGHR